MPQITIDGNLINVENGKTVIEAAYQNGLEIPHFCWHPELSVAGNCRMCLVEIGMPKKNPNGNFELNEDGSQVIQWFPKLQIACATQVTDGMAVRTKNDKVVAAQESVMEFLLINHPLDCPICDEAGECKLQDYAFSHSNGESRFVETKVHKQKRTSWGPTIIYDGERCISCSRCVRYAQEIAKQDVLTFVNRGDHVTIELFDNTEFDNDYSMNVVEICPVGALTSKDFRFKTRVWEMSFNDSICPGCSKGCNIKIGVRNNTALRIQPRTNMKVNKYWLCDYGRLTQYPFLNDDRINNNLIRTEQGFKEVSFDEAKNFAVEGLKQFKASEIMVIASSNLTNEDLYALQLFTKQVIKTKHFDFIKKIDESFADNFLKTNDKSPNTRGALEIGIQPVGEGLNANEFFEMKNKNHIKALIIVNEDLSHNLDLINSFDNLEFIISMASNHNEVTKRSDVVFAASTYAEVEGTFTNVDGRVQHFTPALVTKENKSRMGMKMSRWDKFGSNNDHWTKHDERDSKPIWKIITNISNSMSGNFTFKSSEDIFDEIAKQIPAFHNMNYELLDNYRGLVIFKAHNPDKVEVEYVSHNYKPE